MTKKIVLVIILLVVGIAVGYYFGYDIGFEKAVNRITQIGQPDKAQYAMIDDDSSLMRGGVVTEDVNYYEGATGFLARPEARGTYPGLILIHEWWGLNDDIKSIAQDFAEQGYVAFAVDLYNGRVTTSADDARVWSSEVRDNVEPAFGNLGAAVDFLRSRPEVETDKLASVGWCFGGGWSYQMAINDLDIDASVMYYGQFNPDDDFNMMRAGILGHFGQDDASIAVDNVSEFQTALATTNGPHEVYIYPNVGHGFANYRGGDNLAYSQEAALTAWNRTQEFLTKVFSE